MAGARFIITTGRCGSKLLSSMFREHPAVLSLSAFFGTLQSPSVPPFPAQPLAGDEFWHLLSTPRPEFAAIVRRCWTPPDPEAGGQAAEPDGGGQPPLLKVALPHLTAEPEALHEELGGYVRDLPAADAGTQYSRVFGWLGERLGRPYWIERSGGSTWFLPSLLGYWPDGRYVHLVRDGRDVAVSMSGQCGFRLAVLADDVEGTPGGMTNLAQQASAVRRGDRAPVERFGAIWAKQVARAEEQLSALPPSQVMRLRYEDLVVDPARELNRLVDFFGLAAQTPGQWIADSAKRVTRRDPAWRQLRRRDRVRLSAACDPGLRLLGYQ